ncbi:MAG: CDP-alcohol phosphatidyltransferase family protein [Elusimicrobiota bacterium]|nr:CDP-alcohol phosphatidyltransferase family protein [Elusimicrobiota bacterium]
MNIPNIITIFRFLLVPIFLILLSHDPPFMRAALAVFIIAGLSDAADGFIARRAGNVSKLGAFLDPMADKIFIISSFTALAILGLVPLWITIIVAARDFFLFIGWLGLSVRGYHIHINPSKISKFTAFLQMLTVGLVLIKFSHMQYIYYLTALFTVISGGHYMLATLNELSRRERQGE